jgi:peroxiredoxin
VSNWKYVVASLLLLALSLTACGGGDPPQNAGINVGSVAVDFTLEALDGTEASLSQYRGDVVLINFWATWCPPCRAEIPDIEEAYRARQGEGLVVLGVSVDQTHDSVAPFVELAGMTYPVLLDELSQVYSTYRAPGLPMSILVDENGVIQVRHVGQLSRTQLHEYLNQVLK